MLKMIKGCKIPAEKELSEAYEATNSAYIANVDADKIRVVMADFINRQESLLFFVLEVPTSRDNEDALEKSDRSTLHKDVYYIDGLNREKALRLLEEYGDILINDGLSSFGFGTQENNAEIMSGKYNVVTLWTKNPEKYSEFFENHGIYRTEKLVTAWNTFTAEAPGESFTYKSGDESIYTLIDGLKEQGLYFAGSREA